MRVALEPFSTRFHHTDSHRRTLVQPMREVPQGQLLNLNEVLDVLLRIGTHSGPSLLSNDFGS